MGPLEKDRVFSLPANSTREKSTTDNSFSMDAFEILSKLFNCLGLETCKTSENCKAHRYHPVCKFIFPLLLHISVTDIIVSSCLAVIIENQDVTTTFSYMLGCVVVLIIWHILYSKRMELQNLLVCLKKTQRNLKPKCIYIKLLVLLIIVNFSTYVCISLYMGLNDTTGIYCRLYYYYIVDYCEIKPFNVIYFTIKSILMYGICEPFSFLSSLLFCASCYRCKALLSDFRQKVKKIILTKSFHLLQQDTYKEYSEICNVIHQFQKVFSFASLLIFVVNLVRAFILMAMVFDDVITIMVYDFADIAFIIIPQLLLCVVIPFSAAQIHAEMAKNKEAFSYFYQELNICVDIEKANLKVIKGLKQTEPIIITAWEMVEFTRTLIPSIIGGFLTYGLLIVNIGKNEKC